jgi:hypothetical protein
MSRSVLGAFGLLFVLAASGAGAEPAAAPATAIAECDREATAIGRSACRLGLVLAGQSNGALVVAAPAMGDGRVVLSTALSERLTQLVAAKLGSTAHPQTASLADAQRIAGSARGLVYLGVALYRDRLEVNADAYAGAGHFWQRLRDPRLHLKAHASAASPLDPELRALFPAIAIVVTRIDKGSLPERDVLALACGDVRGDGSSEIATIGRRRVQVGSLERGRFAARASLNWAENSAVAASPLREPIAAASLASAGHLWVGLSDRADALELSGALQVEHKWHGVMPWPGGGCTRRAGLGYDGKWQACPGASPAPSADLQTPIDAFASRVLANQSGQSHTLRVARPVGSDAARALDSLQPEVNVPNVGAQLAVGDLDEDGQPEIVTSSPSLDRHADQVVVRTVTDNGQLRERLRLPVPSGIDAIAVCPGDGRAMAPLALATGDGIWVIR